MKSIPRENIDKNQKLDSNSNSKKRIDKKTQLNHAFILFIVFLCATANLLALLKFLNSSNLLKAPKTQEIFLIDNNRKSSKLTLTLSNTEIPINGQLKMDVLLTDNNNQPLANRKIVFTYDEGWNYGEYIMTDSQGKASYTLSLKNDTKRTGFCGRGGSQKVPSTYQAIAYFQGDPEYKGSMARRYFGAINSGEAPQGGPVTEVSKDWSRKQTAFPMLYWGWDYGTNYNPNDAPEDLLKPYCEPGSSYPTPGGKPGDMTQCKNDPNIKTTAYGPFGTIFYVNWQSLRFPNIDGYLDAASKMIITLPDGRQMSKPVMLGIPFYDSSGDLTPSDVKAQVGGSYILKPPQKDSAGNIVKDASGNTVYCAEWKVPKYCDQRWQDAYKNMVYELGRRYDGKITANLISFGYDGEAVDVKNSSGCDYKAELNKQCTQFWRVLDQAMRWHREAFPTTAVYLQGMFVNLDVAFSVNPPIGYKMNNWTANWNSWAYKSNSDRDGESKAYYFRPNLPRGVESKNGGIFNNTIAGTQRGYWGGTYWMLLNMLAMKPDFIDFHTDHWGVFLKIPWLSEFINSQLGKTVVNTPIVWTTLREVADNMQKEDYDCWQSGVYGDYSFYLYRRENISGNKTVPITRNDLSEKAQWEDFTNIANNDPFNVKSLSPWYTARRTDQASGNNFMSFDIDNGWSYAGLPPGTDHSYKFILTYLDKGNDKFFIEYKDGSNQLKRIEVIKQNSGGWIRKQFDIQDAYFNDQLEGLTDLRINSNGDGDETIHMLDLRASGTTDCPKGGCPTIPPTPKPPATPTIPPTSNPTPKPPVTPTVRPTPTPTVRPTPTIPPTTPPNPGDKNTVLKIKLLRVNQSGLTIKSKVAIKTTGSNSIFFNREVIFISRNDGIFYSEPITIDQVNSKLSFSIKAEKHLARIFNNISFQNTIDLTNVVLLAGDISLPESNGQQSGEIDEKDRNFIIQNWNKTDAATLKIADLNYDGKINAIDSGILIESLSTKPDENF
jgi:hypothetical protein